MDEIVCNKQILQIMIVRIVQMKFKPETLTTFSEIFAKHRLAIRKVSGCLHLELHKDTNNEYVRYTYSIWESEDALNAYRNSELFASVWPKTKALFAAKPLAFSMIKLEEIG